MNEELIKAACALRIAMAEETLTERAREELWTVREYLIQLMTTEEFNKYSELT